MSCLTLQRTEAFTGTGNGTVKTWTGRSFKYWALLVTEAGGIASTWDVRLEGSIDGTNWEQIIQHTNVDGSGKTKNAGPLLFTQFRIRCAGITGGGTLTCVAVGSE